MFYVDPELDMELLEVFFWRDLGAYIVGVIAGVIVSQIKRPGLRIYVRPAYILLPAPRETTAILFLALVFLF